MIKTDRACANCNAQYEPKSHNQKWCSTSDCQKAKRLKHRTSYMENLNKRTELLFAEIMEFTK